MMIARYAAGICALGVAAALGLSGCVPDYPGPGPASTGSTTASGDTTSGTATGRTSTTGGTTSPTTHGSTAPVAYSWGLPPSDTSVAGNDGPAYAELQQGCAQGQAYLDAVAPDGYGFRSPLNVVLFAAGLRLCLGDRPGARNLYEYGASRYGLSGLPEGKPECELYKSVRSVLEQQPRASFPCPGGLPPQDIVGDTGLVDDPLTMDVDESQPLETGSTATESTESTESTGDEPETTPATEPASPSTDATDVEFATPTP